MAILIDLKTFVDERGSLTVIDRVLPFDIKRVFYIYGVDSSVRGNHRHKKTVQAAISLRGSCRISTQSNSNEPILEFDLDAPSKCLIINPEDYHWMDCFTPDCILMVVASEFYDAEDYITDNY